MVLIATSLYLPEHVSTIAKRAFYYYAGDAEAVVSSASQSAATLGESVVVSVTAESLRDEVTGWAAAAVETAARGAEAAVGAAAGEL